MAPVLLFIESYKTMTGFGARHFAPVSNLRFSCKQCSFTAFSARGPHPVRIQCGFWNAVAPAILPLQSPLLILAALSARHCLTFQARLSYAWGPVAWQLYQQTDYLPIALGSKHAPSSAGPIAGQVLRTRRRREWARTHGPHVGPSGADAGDPFWR